MWFALLANSVSVSAQEESAPEKSAQEGKVSPGVLTLMDVFELEFASDPQISPDDRRVAYVLAWFKRYP